MKNTRLTILTEHVEDMHLGLRAYNSATKADNLTSPVYKFTYGDGPLTRLVELRKTKTGWTVRVDDPSV